MNCVLSLDLVQTWIVLLSYIQVQCQKVVISVVSISNLNHLGEILFNPNLNARTFFGLKMKSKRQEWARKGGNLFSLCSAWGRCTVEGEPKERQGFDSLKQLLESDNEMEKFHPYPKFEFTIDGFHSLFFILSLGERSIQVDDVFLSDKRSGRRCRSWLPCNKRVHTTSIQSLCNQMKSRDSQIECTLSWNTTSCQLDFDRLKYAVTSPTWSSNATEWEQVLHYPDGCKESSA